MRSCLAVCLLLLAMPAAVAAQAVVGGSAEMRVGVLVNPDDPAASPINGAALFRPTLHAGTGDFTLHFQATVGLDPATGSMSVVLDSLRVDTAPADFLRLSIGRFSYATGAAVFLAPTSFFSSVDYDALFEGRLADAILPADLVQVRLLEGDVSLTCTVAPFPRRAPLPATDSPWFPRKDLPASIHVTFPIQQDLVLAGITMESPDLPAAAPQTMSASLEGAATVGPLDLSFLYYHGYDLSPLVQARFDFPQGLFQDYNVILTPVDRLIDALGLTAVLGISDFQLTADVAYTLSKTFLTRQLSSDTFETVLATAPLLQYALGAGWTSDQPSLSLLCEWKGAWVPAGPAGIELPMLSSALFGRASLGFWEDRITLATNVLVSLADKSLAIAADCTFSPSSEVSIQLLAPFFIDAADTELGEFSANHLVSLGATWRF